MLDVKQTGMFFDRQAVMKLVGQKERQGLSKAGGLTRRVARQSIPFRKNRDLVSSPGRPPISHTKGLGIRTIFYSYDANSRSVICGPVRLTGTKDPKSPEKLEKGGTSIVRVRKRRVTRGRKESNRRRNKSTRARSQAEIMAIKSYYSEYQDQLEARMKSVTIAPRPFMGPALDKVKGQLAGLWR